MRNLSATQKGLITGIVLVAASLGFYSLRGSFSTNLQYIAYAIYIAGILWTLISYYHQSPPTAGFKDYFSQGFKCFIVVTLIMVAFTYIFLKMNPGFREEMAANYRLELVKKGNYTPAEMDDMVLKAKAYFITMLTSMAVFSYLVIGALVTLVASAFLIQRKRSNNPTTQL